MADPFVPPFKTGFVDNTAPQAPTKRTCVEYPFEWHDGNPDDEDRNGYGVSLKEGKLVVGGKPSIGVASRTDEYDPSLQWVVVGGFTQVRSFIVEGASGYLDTSGLLVAKQNSSKKPRGKICIVIESIDAPETSKKIFQRTKCVKEGRADVLIW